MERKETTKSEGQQGNKMNREKMWYEIQRGREKGIPGVGGDEQNLLGTL